MLPDLHKSVYCISSQRHLFCYYLKLELKIGFVTSFFFAENVSGSRFSFSLIRSMALVRLTLVCGSELGNHSTVTILSYLTSMT